MIAIYQEQRENMDSSSVLRGPLLTEFTKVKSHVIEDCSYNMSTYMDSQFRRKIKK